MKAFWPTLIPTFHSLCTQTIHQPPTNCLPFLMRPCGIGNLPGCGIRTIYRSCNAAQTLEHQRECNVSGRRQVRSVRDVIDSGAKESRNQIIFY
eukprot:3911166-Rhodomonas_salina.1